MNPDHSPGVVSGSNREAEATGLPWPRTWRGVYVLVLVCFCFWLGTLILLTFLYS